MWPFKKKQQNIKTHQEIDDYRICFIDGVYTIQKYYQPLDRWETLHYLPHIKEYNFWYNVDNRFVLSFKTLREARLKVLYRIPQYFSAELPSFDDNVQF